MSKIEEAKKLLIDAGNLCAEEIGTDERIKIHALIKVVLALLESEPEPTELTTLARRFLPPKEAFAQVDITDVSEQPGQLELICHKLCKEIDRLTAENAKQKQLIELIEYAVSRRGHYE